MAHANQFTRPESAIGGVTFTQRAVLYVCCTRRHNGLTHGVRVCAIEAIPIHWPRPACGFTKTGPVLFAPDLVPRRDLPVTLTGLVPRHAVCPSRILVFKNLTLYRLDPSCLPTLERMEDALDGLRFQPCSASQDKSVGWVEPRGEAHAALVESINRQRILKLSIETKAVPTAVVRKKAQEAADHIEATTGRKPGKKETKALREEALQALLPQAFARQGSVWVWIDPDTGILATDASSQSRQDDVITAWVTAFPSLQLSLVNTQVTPQTAMANWLASTDPDEWPAGFAIERECELKSSDEEKSVVRYTRHHLLTEEVRLHLQQGKRPTRLAMSWEGRMAFTLSESMQLRKLAFLEGLFDDQSQPDDAGFDTDVALATGELKKLIPALIDALGGELALGEPSQASTATAHAPLVTQNASVEGDDAPF